MGASRRGRVYYTFITFYHLISPHNAKLMDGDQTRVLTGYLLGIYHITLRLSWHGWQKLASGSAKTAVHLEKLFFYKGFEAPETFLPCTGLPQSVTISQPAPKAARKAALPAPALCRMNIYKSGGQKALADCEVFNPGN